MNILYCGDGNIEQGLTLSLLSLLEHQREPLQVYVLTAGLSWQGKDYRPISQNSLRTLEQYVQKRSPESSISRFDITDLVLANLPEANMGTRFTPCCMLRLYADRIPELPGRLLYLDTDVLCRGTCRSSTIRIWETPNWPEFWTITAGGFSENGLCTWIISTPAFSC